MGLVKSSKVPAKTKREERGNRRDGGREAIQERETKGGRGRTRIYVNVCDDVKGRCVLEQDKVLILQDAERGDCVT